MSDKNDLNFIKNKLDNISLGISKILLELAKKKKISSYPKLKTFVPNKFFNDFLKPQLLGGKKLTKREMFNLCEKRGKYNSYNTLSNYLYKLEKNQYIQSERILNKKYYMLKPENN